MDQDTRELISILCTRAAMIMEDISLDALTVGAVPDEEARAKLEKLTEASRKISVLLQAAESLDE